MSNEHASPGPEMSEFEAALGSLAPSLGRVDRDRIMYRAGQASIRPSSRGRRGWIAATTVLGLVASGESILLARRGSPEVVERTIVVRGSATQPDKEPEDVRPVIPPVQSPGPGPGPHDRLAWQVLRSGLDGLPTPTASAWGHRAPSPSHSRRALREELSQVLDLGDPSWKRMLAMLALSSAWGPLPAPAQSSGEPSSTTIILRPAPEPRPALKYRLVPEPVKLVPGNAAIFYHRALWLASDKRSRLDAERKAAEKPPGRAVSVDDQISQWINDPISEVPVDQARVLLENFRSSLAEVDQGATRSTCDWEFDRRPEGITLLLPEIQGMRTLARLVALQARLAILGGKPDEAIHHIVTGLVMGRHVARGPIVIQALVGLAIDFVMVKCLEELIQTPGAPNFYWALADRPRPFIDLRAALEGERYLLEREIPGLEDLEKGVWSLDRARKFADELQRKVFSFESGKFDGSTAQRFGVAAMTAKVYPLARRALIAEGRPEAEVEAMPVVQVASLYCYQEHRRLQDESYKWLSFPYWQSYDRVDASVMTTEQTEANPLLTLFRTLTSPFNSARLAALRLDRQLDALQCVEAIRLHASSHNGKLPETLESLLEAPAPFDPATGKPFFYKVDGDTATLSAPLAPGAPNHPAYAIRYTLKPAR